jgi:hypothetical protein
MAVRDDEVAAGTPRTRPPHVPDVGIFNDAVVGTLSGGQHLSRDPPGSSDSATSWPCHQGPRRAPGPRLHPGRRRPARSDAAKLPPIG